MFYCGGVSGRIILLWYDGTMLVWWLGEEVGRCGADRREDTGSRCSYRLLYLTILILTKSFHVLMSILTDTNCKIVLHFKFIPQHCFETVRSKLNINKKY